LRDQDVVGSRETPQVPEGEEAVIGLDPECLADELETSLDGEAGELEVDEENSALERFEPQPWLAAADGGGQVEKRPSLEGFRRPADDELAAGVQHAPHDLRRFGDVLADEAAGRLDLAQGCAGHSPIGGELNRV